MSEGFLALCSIKRHHRRQTCLHNALEWSYKDKVLDGIIIATQNTWLGVGEIRGNAFMAQWRFMEEMLILYLYEWHGHCIGWFA
jgi:hypothetical protein